MSLETRAQCRGSPRSGKHEHDIRLRCQQLLRVVIGMASPAHITESDLVPRDLYNRGTPATRQLAEECVRVDPHARGGGDFDRSTFGGQSHRQVCICELA